MPSTGLPAVLPSRPAHTFAPAAEPAFRYTGDPHCAVTYRAEGNGSMFWTVTTTVAGELTTHATDHTGKMYVHQAHVGPGGKRFEAPVSLADTIDVGAALTGEDGSRYGCSARPGR